MVSHSVENRQKGETSKYGARMFDYDRRRLASTETVSTISWWSVEWDKIVESALLRDSARSDKYSVKQLKDNEFTIQGTTMDGRSFTTNVVFKIDKGSVLTSIATTRVEGTVDMGSVPEALEKVASVVSHFEEVMKSVDLDRDAAVSLFLRDYGKFLLPTIEAWRQGRVVDKKQVRSQLRFLVKRIESIKLNSDQRALVPPGENKPLWKIVDATRIALGAATRSVK